MTSPLATTFLVDAQALQGNDPERGIPRWLGEFSRALRGRDVKCVGLTNPDLRDLPVQFHDCFDEVIENRRPLVRNATAGNRVVYVVGSPFEPIRPIRNFIPDHILEAGMPIATVMYDLALYRYPEFYQIRPGDAETYAARRRLFQWSDLFLAISDATARDLVEIWQVPSDRISVIGTGISAAFVPSDERSPDAPNPFVLCVGRRDPRKQTAFLIKMFAQLPLELRARLKLVIVCRLDSETEEQWRFIGRDVGLDDDQLVLTGMISDLELRDLYQNCEVFVEPSLYEGFGLPLAEAAACGAVTICSNSSSLPEVLGTTENLFDPFDLASSAALLERSLTDHVFRSRMKEAALQSVRFHQWTTVATRAHALLGRLATEVSIPYASMSDYLARGFPRVAIGRSIPLTCLDN